MNITGEGITEESEGIFICSISSLQSKTYTFNISATADCKGELSIALLDANRCEFEGFYRLKLSIPINYSQEDIAALKAIAEANPNSIDLERFIEEEYYLKNWDYSSGYNVGVVWSQDTLSRVIEFTIKDYEQRVNTLDFSALTELEKIYITWSYITTLDLSKLSKLNHIELSNTNLLWDDVTFPSNQTINIWGRTTLEDINIPMLDENTAYVQSGIEIDLSAYAQIGDEESTYQWWRVIRDPYEEQKVTMDLAPGGIKGKFTLTGNPGEYYYCEIRNPKYGDWSLVTPEIKIARSSDDYSATDTLALRELAKANPQIPQLKEFVDSKGWERENWDTYDDVIYTDWTVTDESGAYRLTHLRIELPFEDEPKTITSLDLSAFTELEWFECERWMTISELDLSNNKKLKHLHVFSPNLESIDASMCPDLEYFGFIASSFDGFGIDDYDLVKLTQINLDGCSQLVNIQLENAHIQSFDFSKHPQLTVIRIDGCNALDGNCLDVNLPNLTYLYLPNTTQFGEYIQNLPASLRTLDLSETTYELPAASVSKNLRTLGVPTTVKEVDLDDYPNLSTLDIGFGSGESQLKYSNIKGYRDNVNYNGISTFKLSSPSHPGEGTSWYEIFENGDTIDLSSEAIIKGVESIFLWVNAKYNTEEKNALKAVEGRPGVFVLDSQEEEYGDYWCKIMNPQFCEITDINDWNGWQMQTSNIHVETGHPSVFHQGDVQVLARIVSESNSEELNEWWSSGAWQSNKNSNVAQAVWNNEEPCRLTELYLYGMGNSFAESVDLRDLDRLEILSLASNNVSEVILPNEKGNLRSLMLPYTKVNSLVVSPYTALEYLDVTQTPLQALDLSNNANLTELFLNYTAVEGIEISPEVAENLVSYGLPSTATSIDLSKFPNLKHFNPSGTTMRFSDVENPRQMEETYASTTYNTGTSDREGLSTYGSTLSFPDEMTVSGQPSSITWSALDGFDLTDISINASGNSYTIADDVPPRASISAQITNTMFLGWTLYIQTTVYTCDGDANLDKKVNVADITATTSYILGDIENMIDRFGDNEADVNYDDYINVADITGIVNIIQGKPVTKASTLRDAYQPTVLLELDDKGFLTMTSQVPVAGIQLELAGATAELPLLGEAAHLTQASTLNGDTLRTLGYSMDGKTIPAGKTVIMQLPAGVKLLKAAFSDAEATSLKAEGDILPTAIETIQTADQAEAVRNYPNPFSGSTTFSYTLKEPATKVAIQIFSTSGAQVETLEGLPGNAGLNRYTTGIQLPGGIYYYRLLLDGKAAGEANTMMIK